MGKVQQLAVWVSCLTHVAVSSVTLLGILVATEAIGYGYPTTIGVLGCTEGCYLCYFGNGSRHASGDQVHTHLACVYFGTGLVLVESRRVPLNIEVTLAL